MKLLLVVLAVSLVPFIEAMSFEDNTGKCIEKYLRDEFNHLDLTASKAISVGEDLDVVKLLDMNLILKRFFGHWSFFCGKSYFGLTTRKPKEDENRMKCFRQFKTKDIVGGETSYKVDIELRPNDVNYNKYYVIENYKENYDDDDDNDDDSISMYSKSKKINYFKRMWTTEIMQQLNITIKQQKQLENDVIQFEKEWKNSLMSCYLEELNEQ